MAEIVKNRPQELTRAELEIMQVLWARGPPWSTASSTGWRSPNPPTTPSRPSCGFSKKGFVSHKAYGKTYEYFPLITRDEYARRYMDGVLKNFFGGSLSRLVSFFSEQKAISLEETDAILRMLQNDTSQNDVKQ